MATSASSVRAEIGSTVGGLRSMVVAPALTAGRRLREHDVGVGAAETERVDPGYPSLAVGKWPARSGDVDASSPPANLLAGTLEMQIGRDVRRV